MTPAQVRSLLSPHVCRDAGSDDSADHHCLGPHGEDEPWYCVDCGHEGPEVLILPDGTVNGNALARMRWHDGFVAQLVEARRSGRR